MLIIEEAIKFFGQSPQDKFFNEYLTKIDINQRPEFIENPEEWIGRTNSGFILMFREKLGYEKLYGLTKASGSMIFVGVRLHSAFNKNNFSAYPGKLPFKINFNQSPDEVKRALGEPDYEDEPNTPERVFMWNEVHNLQLGLVLTNDEQHICYLTLKPTRKKS